MVQDGTSNDIFAKHSKTETDEGTALIKEFLNEWKAGVEAQSGGTDGDEAMALSEEAQIEELRKVAERYKDRFEASPWIRDVLAAF